VTGVVFAVLAHAHPECLADQVENLAAFAPGSQVVVFNGGRNPNLAADLPVLTCPYSKPLIHHWLGAFHGLVMQWLAEEALDFEFLVTLDSDMLLLKSGFPEHLRSVMTGSAYVGAHFAEVLPDTPWRPGRRFHRKWSGAWQQLFDLPHPYRAFNPGQVFGREYVDAFMAWPRRQDLMAAVEQTRLDALEEIVWPTLAASLDLRPMDAPGGRSLQLRRHAPTEIGDYVDDPSTFLLHRVGMTVDAPERVILRRLAAGENVEFPDVPYDYATEVARPSVARSLASYAKDALLAAAPATRR
jgi:hypothetical protein